MSSKPFKLSHVFSRTGRWLGASIAVWLTVTCVPTASAQRISIEVTDEPLEEVLQVLRLQAGIDMVYAQRLIRGLTATCQYQGDDLRAAFACVLQATGLRAQLIRGQQYVLVGEGETDASLLPNLVRRGVLNGFVVDAVTGEVLPGAHVYLPESGIGAITNEAGYFAIPSLVRRTHTVRFSYLGYQLADTLLAVNGRVKRIVLQPSLLFAEGIEVQAEESRRAGLGLFSVPGLVNLPVQQLATLPSLGGEPDLFRSLQWLPGISKAGFINGGMVIRGGAPDQNLYLIDGAPVYHPWHAFRLISTFQTETFKDIRLYRSAFPAAHGGRLSAVLDAQLKDGSLDRPRAQAALSLLSGRFVIESPINSKSSFMLSGRRSYIDKLIGRRHPVAEAGIQDTLRTGYFFWDWSAKATYRPTSRSRLSFSYYNGRDVLDVRLPFDLSIDFSLGRPDWLKRPADFFFEIDQNWGNRLYSVRYQYLLSRRFFIAMTAYDSAYNAFEGSIIRPSSTALLNSQYRVRLRDIGLKWDIDYYHSRQHQVQAGVHVVQHRFRSWLDALIQRSTTSSDSLREVSRQETMEWVAYIQDTWKPTARWHIQPGLRWSYFSSGSYANLNPSFNVQYAFDPNYLIVRGAVGTQVQYMQRIRDRFSFIYDMISSRWVPAQDDVKPATSFQVALGADSHPTVAWTLSAGLYWRSTNHVLLPQDELQTKNGLEGPGIELGTLLGQYTPGRGQAYGLELSAQYDRAPWLIWVNYLGGRSLNRAPALGEDGFRPARFDVPRSMQAVLTYRKERWHVSLSSEVRSGYPNTDPVARYTVTGPLDTEPQPYLHRPAINNGRLPAYIRVDLTAGYRFRFLSAQWEAQMQIYNLTNRRNVLSRTYDPEAAIVTPNDIVGVPLIPLLELQMEL